MSSSHSVPFFCAPRAQRSLATSVCAAVVVAATGLLSLPSHADRYWDVKEKAAGEIATAVMGNVVVEYCPGCDGGIFIASRILNARVAKGDYSGDKQVKIIRGPALLGNLTSDGTLNNPKCFPSGGFKQDQAVEALGFEPTKLDIPYASLITGGDLVWVGAGRLDGDGANIALNAAARVALTKCVAADFGPNAEAQPASAFLFAEAGAFSPATHEVDVDGDGKKDRITWALVKGTLVRDVLPPRKKKITVRYVEMRLKKTRELLFRQAVPADVDAEGPTGDISGLRAGVVFTQQATPKSPSGFGVLLSTPLVDDFAFVETSFVSKKKRGLKPRARLHWLGQFPRRWKATFQSQQQAPVLSATGPGGTAISVAFDSALGRFTSKTLRWAVGDELNVRQQPRGGTAKVGHLDVGDVTPFKAADSNKWTPVMLRSGGSGYVFSKFMGSAAPFFDVSAGAKDGRGVRRRATLLEAMALDFNQNDLKKIRAFGDRVRNTTRVSDVCKRLAEAKTLSNALSMQFFKEKWSAPDADNTIWNRAFEVIPRITSESQALEFIIFSEGSTVNIISRNLGARLPKRAPERRLLSAADALMFQMFPIWIEQTNDFGGCTKPRQAIPSLKWLAQAYPKSATCLKQALQPKLGNMLKRMSKEQCFCQKKKPAKAAIAAAAKTLATLKDFDGEALGAAWKTAAASDGADFDSSCAP